MKRLLIWARYND